MNKIKPRGEVLETLTGKFSEKTHNNNDEKVNIVESGSGMVGIECCKENKEWSGIFEHIIRTGRLASFLAEKLKQNGIDIDPELVLNTVLVSHCGRRQWDEAQMYPDIVKNSITKQTKTDTDISVELLKQANLSPDIIKNVKAHQGSYSLPEIAKNWVAKVALYADYRTTQHIVSLSKRFNDFEKKAIDTGKMTKEQFDKIKIFYMNVEKEIFEILKDINPEDINDNNPPALNWEKYIRRLYINDAEKDIFKQYSKLKEEIEKTNDKQKKEILENTMQKLFPKNTWWGEYVRKLYEKQDGKEYKSSRDNVKAGISRAIAFFKNINNK